MSDGGNPFLLPGAPGGSPLEPPVESGTRRMSRADPAAPPTQPSPAIDAPAPVGPPASTITPGTRWSLVLPDGTELPIDGPVLLGRDPEAPDDVRGAHPVAVRDPEKTVSKTHALLRPDPAGVRVRDLFSTNGTALVLSGGRIPVPAEGDVLVTQPAQLVLGRYTVRLEP
jgi:pSer/pThr/pTyr-binding forkhead associated (FHA) protein